MSQKDVNFEVSKEDRILIDKIVSRAVKEHGTKDPLSLTMDLCAVHHKTPLRLQEFLDADMLNFVHDVSGIMCFFDRDTATFKNFFEPRFTDYEIAKELAQKEREEVYWDDVTNH